jgi:hypothetical protein
VGGPVHRVLGCGHTEMWWVPSLDSLNGWPMLVVHVCGWQLKNVKKNAHAIEHRAQSRTSCSDGCASCAQTLACAACMRVPARESGNNREWPGTNAGRAFSHAFVGSYDLP